MLATARLASLAGGLSENYTTTTYGPIWPEFLAILNQLGMDLNHFNAHRVALILKICIFLIPQYILLKKTSIFKLGPVLLPLNFAIFLPTTNDFAFLASELLPLSFLSLAVLVVFIDKGLISNLLAGVFFTLSLFSKYQSILMVTIIVMFFLVSSIDDGVVNYRKFRRDALQFSISVAVSIFLFFAMLLSSNSLSKFLKESFLLSIEYSTAGRFGGGQSFLEKMNVGSTLLLSQPLIVFALLFLALGVQKEVSPFSKVIIRKRKLDSSILAYTLLAFFVLIGFFTISIPGNSFPHYLYFFVWIIIMYLFALDKIKLTNTNFDEGRFGFESIVEKKVKYGVLVLILMISLFSTFSSSTNSVLTKSRQLSADQANFKLLKNSEVLTYCPEKSQVLVWGWAAEMFAYFDWVPTPNVVNEIARIRFSQISPDSTIRIRNAISNLETDCVYEAVGPSFFGGFSKLEGIESLPVETLEILTQGYELQVLGDGTSVWSRR